MKNVIAMLFVCAIFLVNTSAYAATAVQNYPVTGTAQDPNDKNATIAIGVAMTAFAAYVFIPSVQEKVNNFFVGQDKQGTVVMGVQKSF